MGPSRGDSDRREGGSWDECLGRRHLTADPVEPQHGLDPETWAVICHDEPRWVADWKATLTCGHRIEVRGDAEWTPDKGMKLTPAERVTEMRVEMAGQYAPEPIPEYWAKRLDAGWPELMTHLDCDSCPVVRKVRAYEPVDWLVAPPKPARKPRRQKSRHELLEERIRRTERELRQLRSELKDQPRRERNGRAAEGHRLSGGRGRGSNRHLPLFRWARRSARTVRADQTRFVVANQTGWINWSDPLAPYWPRGLSTSAADLGEEQRFCPADIPQPALCPLNGFKPTPEKAVVGYG
jgi:hypothetical protein